MQTSFKEITKFAFGCCLAMLTIPVAYRVWLAYHPESETTTPSWQQFLDQANENNARRLLVTPVGQWHEQEKKAEPKIYAWLVAHERIVLPWEWTDTAIGKNSDGYCDLWSMLFKEQKKLLQTNLKRERRKLESLQKEIEIAGILYQHHTNQIACARNSVASNTYPMTIQVERLSKGRFWGWNKKIDFVRLKQRLDFEGSGESWLEVEWRNLKAADQTQQERLISQRWLQDTIVLYSSKLEELDKIMRQVSEREYSKCLKVICNLIRL